MSNADHEMREYTRKLFSTDPHEVEPEPERTRSNHVPHEGHNPERTPDGDEAMRDYTRELFDRAYFTN